MRFAMTISIVACWFFASAKAGAQSPEYASTQKSQTVAEAAEEHFEPAEAVDSLSLAIPTGILFTAVGVPLFVLGQYVPPWDAPNPMVGVGAGFILGGLVVSGISGIRAAKELPPHLRPRHVRIAASAINIVGFSLAGVSVVGLFVNVVLSVFTLEVQLPWETVRSIGVASVYTLAATSVLYLIDDALMRAEAREWLARSTGTRCPRPTWSLIPMSLGAGGGFSMLGRF